MNQIVRIEWNIPNLLSLLRILLVPLFVVLFLGSNQHPSWIYWSYGVLALSGISDALDGLIARKFNQITDFGKLLDPIADKLTQIAVVICMAIRYNQLIPLAVLCFIKESCQSIGGMLLLHKGSTVRGAKWYGKLSTICFYAVMISLLAFPGMPKALFWCLVALVGCTMLFAFINYTREYCRLSRQLPKNKKETSSTSI